MTLAPRSGILKLLTTVALSNLAFQAAHICCDLHLAIWVFWYVQRQERHHITDVAISEGHPELSAIVLLTYF